MAQVKDAALAHELKRWMRPDAHRFVRPDVESILEKAKQLAASGYSSKYLRCLDLCSPLLERFQLKGADINEGAYRRCINACMGK